MIKLRVSVSPPTEEGIVNIERLWNIPNGNLAVRPEFLDLLSLF